MGLIRSHLNSALVICNVSKTQTQKHSYLHVWGIGFLRQHLSNAIERSLNSQFTFKHTLQYTLSQVLEQFIN